jgi:hypothetical protein
MEKRTEKRMDIDPIIDEEEDEEPLIDTSLFKEHIRTKIVNIFQNVFVLFYVC